LNEAIGEKDEEDADIDVASLTRLQVKAVIAVFFVDEVLIFIVHSV
jgi:hypothetical protein